jgi:hypothetical protein
MMATQDEDWQWLTRDVVYGLFYSDDGVLSYLETELLTYTAIACQQSFMALLLANQLKGLTRMGLDREQCEGVTRVTYRVAEWMGIRSGKRSGMLLIGARGSRKSIVISAILIS